MAKCSFFTTNEIKPAGWLKRQLEIQAGGLSGNLDKMWPDVKDSAWIGGDREGWERVPYWLDGFIPLAYLLDDADMKRRVSKYIEAILANQDETGWICPCSKEQIPQYDTWAVQLISKVLVVYYRCSNDIRIPDVVYKIMKNYHGLLKSGTICLHSYGKRRWVEAFIALDFLKERYQEGWIDELAEILDEQGCDYANFTDRWKRPINEWTYETHVVNLAMMLKTSAVTGNLLKGKYDGQSDMLYSTLMEYNGTPVDIFTGDECLSGLSPIQGTELCAVVELMYSMELLYAYTGDAKWAEHLEKVAFNALPAAISDDMWTHQYDQMSNQISTVRFPGRPIFRTNNHEAHLFGLEPNYGCCTANFNQAWPKLALSAFMYSGDTVLSAVTLPCTLKTKDIYIELHTDYPFKNKLLYTVSADKDFTLKVRIPSFAKGVTVDGDNVAADGYLSFDIKKGEHKKIDIDFTVLPEIIDRPYNLKSVKYGSLVFALPIDYDKKMYEYERDGVVRKYPYCDYEYIGKTEWRYGLCRGKIEIEEGKISDCPFSSANPPIKLKLSVKRINWEYEDGFCTVAAKVPTDIKPIGDEETIEFYPYGCAKLRITELPLCEEK